MKNFLKRLNGRKGFTLVECIVAIAVFAAMVLIVMMILMTARAEAQRANKTEEDLTELINNVVGDETYKKYSADSDVLKLSITGSSDTFDITYNVVDGYKNFVECPTCGHFANNPDFMGTLKPEDFATSGTPFPYLCPSCAATFNQTLECEDCEATGDHNDTGSFTYIPTTGGYVCNSCGSTAVKGQGIAEKVTADAKMSVSGMVPNAIVYGDVEQPATINELVDYTGPDASGADTTFTDGSVNLNLNYKASSNQSLPGTYTLTVTPVRPAGAQVNDFTLDLKFPPHYKFVNFTTVTSSGTCVPTNGDDTDNPSRLTFKFNATGTFKVQFQLVNYKSGFSFEYDYNDASNVKQGLAKYWFNLNMSTPTRDAAGYVSELNASGSIAN